MNRILHHAHNAVLIVGIAAVVCLALYVLAAYEDGRYARRSERHRRAVNACATVVSIDSRVGCVLATEQDEAQTESEAH